MVDGQRESDLQVDVVVDRERANRGSPKNSGLPPSNGSDDNKRLFSGSHSFGQQRVGRFV